MRAWRARRHIRECGDCSSWFAQLQRTEQLLQAVVSHEMPSGLERRLRETALAGGARLARRREGTRMKVIAVCVTVAVLAGVVLASVVIRSHGAAGAIWSQAGQALRRVDVVHMTGETRSIGQGGPTALRLRKEKWVRRQPLAVYEEVSPINPSNAEEASRRYIFAGSVEKVYWYFPVRGNRAVIGKGLPSNLILMDDPLALLEWSGPKPALRISGKSKVGGTSVILLDLLAESQRIEFAVDAKTKSLLMVRQLVRGPDGRETEVTRLRVDYNRTPPGGIFDWAPPAGATVIDRR